MKPVPRRQRSLAPLGLGPRSRPAPPAPSKTPRQVPAAAVIRSTDEGPYLCQNVLVQHPDGEEKMYEKTALCGCGKSAIRPFCDGTHAEGSGEE